MLKKKLKWAHMEEQAVNTFYRELFIESRFLSHACMNKSEPITFIVDEKNNIFQIDFQAIVREKKFFFDCLQSAAASFVENRIFSLSQIRMEMKCSERQN